MLLIGVDSVDASSLSCASSCFQPKLAGDDTFLIISLFQIVTSTPAPAVRSDSRSSSGTGKSKSVERPKDEDLPEFDPDKFKPGIKTYSFAVTPLRLCR